MTTSPGTAAETAAFFPIASRWTLKGPLIFPSVHPWLLPPFGDDVESLKRWMSERDYGAPTSR